MFVFVVRCCSLFVVRCCSLFVVLCVMIMMEMMLDLNESNLLLIVVLFAWPSYTPRE